MIWPVFANYGPISWKKKRFPATLIQMGKLRHALNKAERSRLNMSVTITLLVLVGAVSFKYPIAFLVFLILGLAYAVYRIIKERRNRSVPHP